MHGIENNVRFRQRWWKKGMLLGLEVLSNQLLLILCSYLSTENLGAISEDVRKRRKKLNIPEYHP